MSDTSPSIILLHGIWFRSLPLLWLSRQLQRRGYRVRRFAYPGMGRPVANNARALAAFLKGLPESEYYLVGHSMGGFVIQRCLLDNPQLPVKGVVSLATPFLGAKVANTLAPKWWGRLIMGRGYPTLAEGNTQWPDAVPVGCVTGDHSAGVGRLFATFDLPNDGTVQVEETRLPAAKDHMVIPASHSGIVYSMAAVRAIDSFIRSGRFNINPV